MMCFLYKVTLGNYIEALELGANVILSYDNQGTCRFKQYNRLHEFMLRQMGYEFEIYVVNAMNITSIMKKLSGKPALVVMKQFFKSCKEIIESDAKSKIWSEDKPNISIIGEIYCCCEEKVNYGIEQKIIKYCANPYNTARAADFLSNKLILLKMKNLFKRDAKLIIQKNL